MARINMDLGKKTFYTEGSYFRYKILISNKLQLPKSFKTFEKLPQKTTK